MDNHPPHGGSPILETQFTCRACGGGTEPFLPFGALPLANALLPPDAPDGAEERFPLTMTVCDRCGLVQLAESIDPKRLYHTYYYQSSNSPAFLDHARALTRRMIHECGLGPRSQVVEIASNDGYLLQYYRHAGVPVLGIEPAVNIVETARARGIETLAEFFSAGLADRLAGEGRTADVVHAHNVLAHVRDLVGVVGGIRRILRRDGVAVIEVPYLVDLIDRLEFDTVYHEHLCYFSLAPLVRLFAAQGLPIFHVERLPIHGGSLRLLAGHADRHPCHPSVGQTLAEESVWGALELQTYRRFADRVRDYRQLLCDFLAEKRAGGRSLAAYGASAKGATLLNYCDVGHETIAFVVDRSPIKQGRIMPGSRLPILPPEELLRRQPDFVLLLAWNFTDEILAQQADYQRRGGRFIAPLPFPRVLAPPATSLS
jgi:SAM-dependent methyltransferase